MALKDKSKITLCTFNCKGVNRSVDCVRNVCKSADIIALQETWVWPHDIGFLGNLDDDFAYTGKSAIDTSVKVITGRPYGGVALLWRKSVFSSVTTVKCSSDRLVAIKVDFESRPMLIFSVYMPYDNGKSDNLTLFTQTLGEIIAITDSTNIACVCVLGDFNAHPGSRFFSELISVCNDQTWFCADYELLPNDTHTFVCQASGSRRWLDHCLITSAAKNLIMKASVSYGVYHSDHYPVFFECNLTKINQRVPTKNPLSNKVRWGERNVEQINNYFNYCNDKLKLIDLPEQCITCSHKMCNNVDHLLLLDNMYLKIISTLQEGAQCTYVGGERNKRKKYVTGWNKYVSDAHREARLCYLTWLSHGAPTQGILYEQMRVTRKKFKTKLKFVQNNQEQIKLDILAYSHSKKEFAKFWKSTSKLNAKPSLPASVAGLSEPKDIANLFQKHFTVQSPLQTNRRMFDEKVLSGSGETAITFLAKQVSAVIKKMTRGKSPGHDGLSVEHLKNAGPHLCRVLALFFNLCLRHRYLPEDLMRTVVVPVIKDKTGDASEVSNYRPISLATIVAKVLDSLLDQQLAKHVELHDAQFGFKPGLSTESAILCLKQTVQYYTSRKTPVFACFLDLSKAFDLVSYDVLWGKLQRETTIPDEITSLFRYWYYNQKNSVKWAETQSDVYRLECGVRQGGLSSPRLFNLYINRLIVELSSTRVGCHIDSVCTNNISYADDMVLLSPSIGALRKLVALCESYAVSHGLKYNVTKSELMMFKTRDTNYLDVPSVSLCGAPLSWVTKFRYLGHWVTEDLRDNIDLERERRSLAVRCNMLVRRFARCTNQVKVTLFKAFCQSFYTCSLWTTFTQRTYSDLRVQYNNAFRILLGRSWRCSASGMFAEARTDDFYAIIRKRTASMADRLRTTTNSILSVFRDRWDSPLLRHWIRIHTS